MKMHYLCLTALFGAFFNVIAIAGEPLATVSPAWIRPAPPGARTLAGYVTLANSTASPIVITAISSPDFERVELHRTVTANNVTRMESESKITIDPKGQLILQPNGRHLMLVNPHKAFSTPGVITRIRFTLNDTIAQEIEFSVREPTGDKDAAPAPTNGAAEHQH